MKRSLLALAAVVCLLVTTLPAPGAAAPRGGGSYVMPLGYAIREGRLVQGVAFVQGRAAAVRPPKTDPLYTFLARGVRWTTVEPYVVNPANADGAAPNLVASGIANGVNAWEQQVTTDILGPGYLTDTPLAADWTAPDGVNEAYFSATELDSQTVAVTIVWYVPNPPSARQIVEWDQVYNDALPEAWGDASAQPGVWDVQDIATHEVGHSAGLGDLYTTSASEQTMYGYASPGEIKKRTLESGDIAGIRKLYQ